METKVRITGLILAVIMGLSAAVILSSCSKDKNKPSVSEKKSSSSEEAVSSKQIKIDEIDVSSVDEKAVSADNTASKQQRTEEKKQEKATSSRQTVVKQQSSTKKPANKETVLKSAEPVKEKKTAYSCGNPKHRCKTVEDHNFIVSLETKGCSICGSHSCNSFYATDEWGNQCYDITKCPQYKQEKDPSVYCEHCGRKCGLGDNGTCVRFTVDTKCPICGKTVPAKTCHTHS